MLSAVKIVQQAKAQLAQLTGLAASTVSRIEHGENGWQVSVEMLEMKYIPDSGDMLGTYEVTLDEEGNLLTYQRTRRYRRNQLMEDEGRPT